MPNCPRCHSTLPQDGLTICPNCGASCHWNRTTGQVDVIVAHQKWATMAQFWNAYTVARWYALQQVAQ